MRRRFLSSLRPLALAVGFALAYPSEATTIVAPALRAPGTVGYDAEGVPIIQAQNDFDAAFLAGWAHARDRFWQMDRLRRVGSGTLAELLGPAALANDVQLRTLGLRRAAWESWAAASEELRGLLKAYADGVNFWLRTNPLPPEYGALEITVADPWHPVDSIVIGKLLAFQLSFDLEDRPDAQPRRLPAGRSGRQLQWDRSVLRGHLPCRARRRAGHGARLPSG